MEEGENISTYSVGDKIILSNETYKKPVAQIGGYEFKWSHEIKKNGLQYWQCINYNKKNVARCFAVIYTDTRTPGATVTEIKKNHNHAGDAVASERRVLRNAGRSLAVSNPQLATRRVIAQITETTSEALKTEGTSNLELIFLNTNIFNTIRTSWVAKTIVGITLLTNFLGPGTDIQAKMCQYKKGSGEKYIVDASAKWERHVNFLASPLSKTQLTTYNQALDLCDEITAAENEGDEKWFECLTKTGNDDFVCQNIELRLGNDPFNTKLWRIYINFLSSKKNIKVLEIYQRYCRTFFEEKDSRNEYYNEIEKFNQSSINVSKWYIKLIIIETDFGTIDSAYQFLLKAIKSVTTPSKSLFKFATKFLKRYQIEPEKCKNTVIIIEEAKIRLRYSNIYSPSADQELDPFDFNFSNIKSESPQKFAFKNPMIHYLQSYANFLTLRKLQKTCKFFISKQNNHLLIWNLNLRIQSTNGKPELEFAEDSLFAISDHQILDQLKNIWIGNRLDINGDTLLFRLSTLIPKMICKDIKYLRINRQKLTMREIKRLTVAKNVEFFELSHSEIRHSNGDPATLEEVFRRFPNAHTFRWYENSFNNVTNFTTTKLAKLKRTAKLKDLELGFNEKINIDHFLIFFKKNAASNGYWQIRVKDQSPNKEFKDELEKSVKEALESLPQDNEKPELHISSAW